jgi:formylglycine-generating enzyme required for sulfatase activity
MYSKKIGVIPCHSNMPSRFLTKQQSTSSSLRESGTLSHTGMVWIKGSEYIMGCGDKNGRPGEYPQHSVALSGFWMDATEISNAQ